MTPYDWAVVLSGGEYRGIHNGNREMAGIH